jgi:hypothetical protein
MILCLHILGILCEYLLKTMERKKSIIYIKNKSKQMAKK